MNFTQTNLVTSSDVQILIMKIFNSVWKVYFFPGVSVCVWLKNVIMDTFVAILLFIFFLKMCVILCIYVNTNLFHYSIHNHRK